MTPEGSFVQAVLWNGLVFVSGQTGIDRDGHLVGQDIKSQTRQAIENLRCVLHASGSDLERVVKVTWFLTDVNDRAAVAEVRQEFWRDGLPASTLVEISRLASPEMRVEVEAIAVAATG
jgi:2-iminobutanoate/2-iminopropanoate deaminase